MECGNPISSRGRHAAGHVHRVRGRASSHSGEWDCREYVCARRTAPALCAGGEDTADVPLYG